MTNPLGSYIRERRQALGLTQEALAERVGDSVRQSEISRLEGGKVTLPRRERLVALSNALEVTLGDLLLHTGWIEDYHRQDIDGEAQSTSRDDPLPEAAAAGVLEDLSELVNALVAGRERLANATRALDEADQALASTLRALNEIYNTRGEIRPPIGLIEIWETTTVFP